MARKKTTVSDLQKKIRETLQRQTRGLENLINIQTITSDVSRETDRKEKQKSVVKESYFPILSDISKTLIGIYEHLLKPQSVSRETDRREIVKEDLTSTPILEKITKIESKTNSLIKIFDNFSSKYIQSPEEKPQNVSRETDIKEKQKSVVKRDKYSIDARLKGKKKSVIDYSHYQDVSRETDSKLVHQLDTFGDILEQISGHNNEMRAVVFGFSKLIHGTQTLFKVYSKTTTQKNLQKDTTHKEQLNAIQESLNRDESPVTHWLKLIDSHILQIDSHIQKKEKQSFQETPQIKKKESQKKDDSENLQNIHTTLQNIEKGGKPKIAEAEQELEEGILQKKSEGVATNKLGSITKGLKNIMNNVMSMTENLGRTVLLFAKGIAVLMYKATAVVGTITSGFLGFLKSDAWNVSKLSGVIGGIFGGGFENKIFNTISAMGSWALLGAGIGSVVPVIGTTIGGLIGAGIGALMGGIGGKNIAKFVDPLFNWIGKAFTTIGNTISKIVKSETLASITDTIIESVKLYFNTLAEIGKVIGNVAGIIYKLSSITISLIGKGLDAIMDIPMIKIGINNLIKFVGFVYDFFKIGVETKIKNVTNTLKSFTAFLKSLSEGLNRYVEDPGLIISDIKDAFMNLVNSVIDSVSDLATYINNYIRDSIKSIPVIGKAVSIGEKVYDKVIGKSSINPEVAKEATKFLSVLNPKQTQILQNIADKHYNKDLHRATAEYIQHEKKKGKDPFAVVPKTAVVETLEKPILRDFQNTQKMANTSQVEKEKALYSRSNSNIINAPSVVNNTTNAGSQPTNKIISGSSSCKQSATAIYG